MKIYKLFVQNVILERVIYSENCHLYAVEKKEKYILTSYNASVLVLKRKNDKWAENG